jgi:hypothetical protein
MNFRTVSLRLVTFALVACAASVTAYGCSGDDSNAGPSASSNEGGDSTASSSSGGSSGSSGSSSGSVGDSSGGTDAPVIIDTGACASDAATCNSCYTAMQAAQDPLNACAPETVNCIPFTGTVPTHPTL